MGVKIHLTKRGKIGILAIVVLLLAGSGGYLLWRVNQDDTVAPTDSDATGGVGACCGTPGCVAGWKCDTSQSCGETKTVDCAYQGFGYVATCPAYKGIDSWTHNCTGSGTYTCSYNFGPGGSTGGKCVKETSEDPDPPPPGTCDIRKCEWPDTLMSSNNCACEKCNGTNGCSGNPPKCTPDACGSNQESCGVSGDGGMSGCTKSASCVTYHKDCNNPSVVYRYCRPKDKPTNTCDTGSWTTKPTGTYANCASIKYVAKATDSDGIDESSVSVKLNNVARTNVAKVTSGNTTTISETLSSSTNCLAPGSYTLKMSWKDKLGATSTNCALSTTFTVEAGSTNVCDSGSWTTKPTGSYAYCDDIAFVAKATDSDGIDESSISVRLNSTTPEFNSATSGKTTTISGTLSSATKCLSPGEYTLAMDWKDKLGASSTDCALDTSFVVRSQVLNPDWEIVKGVVEKCVDENTENPTSELTYTIAVKNTGEGEGTITKIVDSLDTKVLQSYISNISNSGIFADGDITWTLSSVEKIFAVNQTKVFTYVVTVPKTGFGVYANTVTAYPATGENIIANANIDADCMIDVPDTGILDSTTAKIILGVAFILFGLNFTRIVDLTRKLSISVNDISDDRRKKNFEKKVVKR